jgi:2-polyprenyl-3-methyl-5-hydroxy-6-metoxy-1,4-benzoquinol methylase
VEIEQVGALREAAEAALRSGAALSALSLVAIAAYAPLHTLSGAESLLDRSWPAGIDGVLDQQIRAPLEEQRLRSLMPTLTAIDNDVSIAVRSQYEESPYPQWVRLAPAGKPKSIDAHMREHFPLSSFVELGKAGNLDVLIAGCGTGKHSIGAAEHLEGAQVLAIDLSMSSLCYAQRQTRARGLTNVHYAQADILNLPSIGRTFDVIEAVGVLHHLADPFAGWRVLLSMLRPGGVMALGFYSEIARRIFRPAREFIAAHGYRSTPHDIRKFRQQVFKCVDGTPLKDALVRDFFSLNECRDVLFHVQENLLTLPDIAAFIADNNLQFLGFATDPQIKRKYEHQFPNDPALIDLMQWHRYETDNPHAFIEMYQFWVQKK